MEQKYFKLFLVLMCLSLAAARARASSDDADVYFNAGTEKYLQGNFTESIENLEKAQSLDPKNKKINEFMVKILLEAATQNHMTRNYRQAMVYLEKAKKLDPENPKVLELYQLTHGLLNPEAEKTVSTERNDRIQKNAVVRRDDRITEEAAEARQRTAARQSAVTVRKDTVAASPREERQIGGGPLLFEPGRLKGWHVWMFIAVLLFTSFATVILFIMLLFKYREAANYRMQFIGMEEDLKNAVEGKNSSIIELEKVRESVKYEHQMAENLQKDIKEKEKKDEERLKTEIDSKTREIEERVRAEMRLKIKPDSGQKENFINHQQERFMKYVSDTSTPAEAESDPVLAAARERIALMAQNLYEYAPGAAVDFITKMARSENPAIRTNIVQALANIAKPETFELLFELCGDTDPRVKREVLRNLKALTQKIAAGTISMDATIAEKVKYYLNKEKDRGEWIF